MLDAIGREHGPDAAATQYSPVEQSHGLVHMPELRIDQNNTTRAERARTFVFVGGGTGGHLYPGLAIAERLDALASASRERARSVFICSDRAVDRAVLEPTGREFIISHARPLGLRPVALLRFARSWGASVRACREAYRALAKASDGPVRVVAMGGFVAAPAVQAARAEGLEITLVNLDALPGKANRLIAWRSARAFTALPVAATYARSWAVVPPIVRAGASAGADPATCRAALGLPGASPVLMITGGSLGAGSINDLMVELLSGDVGKLLREQGWSVLHQCGQGKTPGPRGEAQTDRLRRAYQDAGIRAIVEPLVSRMDLWWGAAELALSRAGAGSVAEVWANAVPTVFMPYPYHRDQHQRLNAERLAAVGGAVIETDRIQALENARVIGPRLLEMMSDRPRLDQMRKNLRSLGPADGAERVAKVLWGVR